MALTAEGKELTEANRVGQLAIAARATAVSKILWDGLDVSDIDGSTEQWMPGQVATLRRFYGDSTNLATAYLNDYRVAELGSPADVEVPPFNTAEMRNAALLAGPIRVKMLIGDGMSATEAHSKAFTKFGGIVSRQVLSGGRGAVNRTERRDSRAKGWRRVSDGDPCTFCAMLCSRGPVYGSEQKAQQIGGSGLQFHGSCGCTAEIIYGEWNPTETEQQFIDSYEAAAQEANDDGQSRTQETVLWRMRHSGDFKDSPKIRAT